MKTIKSKIMDIFKEISEDNSRSFADRKYLKEYLGSMLINYRRKSDKKIVMKIYKTKAKKGTEIFIGNTVYFLTVVDGVTIIYNEYGKAVSISFADGYEWNGETFVSEEAIALENNFRLKYQNFINEAKTSNDLVKMFNESYELLDLLANTTCICDTTEIYNNLNSIYNYLDNCLHSNMDTYFNDKLNNVKGINNNFEKCFKQENEVEGALKSLKEYYNWLLDLERVNKKRLNSKDPFFKLVSEMKNHINKLFNKMTISQNDLLDYYHDEIEKMLETKEELTTNFSTKNRNTDVTIEFIDLNDDEPKNDDESKSRKFFKKTTVGEKADYLTFKTLRKYGVDEYQFNAEKISVKNAKKELKKFNKTQNKYEKLINKDNNNEVDEVSYEVYNTVRDAKEDLVNTGIQDEKTSDEIFNETLRNNYDRSVYLKRQQDLKKSASKISKVKDILQNISNENFDKIMANYQKVKRRICAGALAITSFGAGAYKNYQNSLKNNSLVYENDDISIYGSDNQKAESNISYETNLVGFGAEVKETETETAKETESMETNLVGFGAEVKETETETTKETESVETNLVGFGAEVKETESETNKETESMETNLVGFGAETNETETETTKETESVETNLVGFGAELKETESETVKETETEIKAEETEKIEVETEISTEKILDHFGLEEVTVVPDANFNIESIEVVPNETMEVQYETEITTEAPEVEETSTKLNEIQDEKDLLNTYKNELQNLEALLPQSNVELENVRNIGDVVNVTIDANLQNDEYSLIKHSEGHQSVHKDTLPRVICSIIMSDGNSGITAKTMEEAESLLEQGYYVAGYGVLNPYSKDASNLEGFFESEDVVGLVRK